MDSTGLKQYVKEAARNITEKFLIDKYGNLTGFDNIIFTGHMGNQRIGDLLPVNYGIIE
jgi:hypothetical protein